MPLVDTAVVAVCPTGHLRLHEAVERLQSCQAIRSLTVITADGYQARTPNTILSALRRAGREMVGITLSGPAWGNLPDPFAEAIEVTRQIGVRTHFDVNDILLPIYPRDAVEKALSRYDRLYRRSHIP